MGVVPLQTFLISSVGGETNLAPFLEAFNNIH